MLADHRAQSADHAGAGAPFGKQPERFDILSRRVPALAVEEEEREAVDAIARLLGELNAHVGDFRAGLTLLDHADRNSAFAWSWAPIACRDAGAALMRFRLALSQMHEALASCPSLKPARKTLKPVQRRFAEAFPSGRGKQNGAARTARVPPRAHADMCDAAILARVSRAGRRVTHSLDGKAIRFELSERSLMRLVKLRDEAFAAFEPDSA